MTKALYLISSLPAEIQNSPASDLPAVIGHLEALKAEAFARLVTQVISRPTSTDSAQVDGHDRLINVEEAAQVLGMKQGWVRQHQRELPLVNLPGRAVVGS